MCSKQHAKRPVKRSFIETARRTQLLEAAAQTVSEIGYAKASLAQIAARAGISRSVICYHFSTKDELLEALVQQVFSEGWNCIKSRMDEETTAAGRLRAFISADLEFMARRRVETIAVADIISSHRDADGKLRFNEEAEGSIISVISKILHDGQDSGELRPFDVRLMAICISQAMDGALMQWMTDPSIDLKKSAAELVELFDRATRLAGDAT